MTCIAGLVHDGTVYLGGDSAGVSGTALTRRADTKVWVAGEYVFGFTTSFRMGQLLHHAFKPPVPKPSEDLERFMTTRFVDAVRVCLKKGGYAQVNPDPDEEPETGGTFLVGLRGRLFCIDSDYQVAEAADCYDAVGAGAEIAKGALCVLQGLEIPPQERLRKALEAAEHWSGAVCSPFRFVETPRQRAKKRRSST